MNVRKKVINAGIALLIFCFLLTTIFSTITVSKTDQIQNDVDIRIRGGLIIRGISIYVKNNKDTTISVAYNVTHERLFSDAWSQMSGSYDLEPGGSRESMPGAQRFSKVTVTVSAGSTSITKTGFSWISFTIFFP